MGISSLYLIVQQMLSTGIPELTSAEDIAYLRDAFSLDATEEGAREKFKNLIYQSLTTKTTQLNSKNFESYS